jgi:hypothetical protein
MLHVKYDPFPPSISLAKLASRMKMLVAATWERCRRGYVENKRGPRVCHEDLSLCAMDSLANCMRWRVCTSKHFETCILARAPLSQGLIKQKDSAEGMKWLL